MSDLHDRLITSLRDMILIADAYVEAVKKVAPGSELDITEMAIRDAKSVIEEAYNE